MRYPQNLSKPPCQEQNFPTPPPRGGCHKSNPVTPRGWGRPATPGTERTFANVVDDWIPLRRPQTAQDMGRLAVFLATQPNRTAQDLYLGRGPSPGPSPPRRVPLRFSLPGWNSWPITLYLIYTVLSATPRSIVLDSNHCDYLMNDHKNQEK